MKTAFVIAGASLALASCIVIDEQKPDMTTVRETTETPKIRGALSAQRQIIASFYAAASDCTSLGYPTLKVAKTAQHGRVSVEQGMALADFGKDDARSICNGKSVPATVIYYTSEPGFIGADSVAFDRIGVAGAYGYHVYTINVR
jgi:hypothetical protein